VTFPKIKVNLSTWLANEILRHEGVCGVEAVDGGEWSHHAPADLPPTRGNSPRNPLDRRLGGPQKRSGHSGVEKYLFPLPWIEPRPFIMYSPSIYQLSYPGFSEVSQFILKWMSSSKLRVTTGIRVTKIHSLHEWMPCDINFKADHSGRAVYGMNRLRPLEAAALRRTDPPSKESYRLCMD
jgi:hypothetical protein